MPQAAAAPAAEEGTSFFRTAFQSIAIFIGVQLVIKQVLPQFSGAGAATNSTSASVPVAQVSIPAFTDRPQQLDDPTSYSAIPQLLAPIWPADTSVDVNMYVSPSVVMPALSSLPYEALVLEEKGLRLGDYKDTRDVHAEFKVPKEVQRNGTLWAHFYVRQSGAVFDPKSSSYDSYKAYHMVKPLSQYLKKKKVQKTRNLLSGGDASEEDAKEEPEPDDAGPVISSYYHPNFTLSLVPDSGTLNYVQLHPAVREWVTLESDGMRDASGKNGWYYPILYANTFWQLRDHMTELNQTVDTLPLNIHLNNMANWKFSIVSSLDQAMRINAQKAARGETLPGGGDGSEMEEVKRILIDSNIYLLSTTFVVGILHTIFEMLAFKSDVSHWRSKKDNVGVSFRTILANVFMQTIIFLYLVDNTDNTSWMILFGQGMGILVEAWKITKTVNVRVRPTAATETRLPWKFLPYTLAFEDKHTLSETEKATQSYDATAFKYLYVVAVPLLVAYAVYSLYYETHKSWYSYVLTTLVGSVYAYGFLLMVPSLYINYRLKSVAHMPARAMTYKFLNTFIDDLFAFTVKMPTLHRLATLRDDVIFFVYLYQSYKYKVDYSRVNEFGQGGGDEDEVKEGKEKALEDVKKVEAKVGAKAEAKVEEVKDAVESSASGKASGRDTDVGSSTKRR